MKELTLAVLVAVIASSSEYLIKVPTSPTAPNRSVVGSRGWVQIQKLMLPLFENVCEISSDPVIVRLAQEFSLDSGNYTDPNVITNLKNLHIGKKLLLQGEIFSEYDTNHWNQLIAIYDVMYHAKDFDAFYKAAAWARQNMNCGLFVDAIYLAILNRRDTSKLSIPAPYELLPNYFIRQDIIIKGSSLLDGTMFSSTEEVKGEGNAFILDANYTGNVNDDDEDSKLAYFREDIGLNSYYFLRKLKLAPWLNNLTDLSNKYGEYLYHMMKQFSIRYDLERYSNGLPELESIDWGCSVKAYDPMLIYSNGNEFAHRLYDFDVANSSEMEIIQSMEENIETVVSHMRQTGYNKSQILNHLMEILVTRERSYETLARQLLGAHIQTGQFSVLDHLITSQRDPVFWKLNKRIVELVDKSLELMPSYSRNELYFPGVELLNVETKKLMTQFDYFMFDVSDSLKSSTSDTSFQVKIGQQRLNHKPFVIKLNISSLVTGQKGLVKIYLGPKMLPGEFAIKKNMFLLLDLFEITLKKGINIVSKSSEEMKSFSDDFISLHAIRKRVEDAEFGLDALPLNTIDSQIGYPSRLVLPKGSNEGLPLQMFVFIAPFSKSSLSRTMPGVNTEFNSAILSPGYPLDLKIEEHQLFNLPNAIVKDIVITHKGDNKNYGGGGDKKWSGGKTFDPSSRPDYSAKRGGYNEFEDDVEYYADVDNISNFNNGLLSLRPDFTKRKEPVDNMSKRGQYGKKSEYAAKKGTAEINDNNANIDSENTDITNKHTKFTYKKREPYSKKEEYKNKDYASKKNEYQKNLNKLVDNMSVDDLRSVDLEKDEIEKGNDWIDNNQIISNEVDDTADLVKYHAKKKDNVLAYEPTVDTMGHLEPAKPVEEPPQKRWTIFDFIFSPPETDPENSEEKIYE